MKPEELPAKIRNVIEGKIKGKVEKGRRWGKGRKQLLDDLKKGRIMDSEKGKQ
jgi:hypothetical protein